MEPLKEFGKILLTLDNCVVPRERLLNTPSAKDGMTKDVEIDIRIRGCECIQSAGLLLKLPQAAMATAQILFQRFFYAKSLVKFNFYYAAMASLFLAAKIEECNRRLRDILNVFHHLKQKRKRSKPILAMEYVGEEYYRMRNTVNKYERYILKELGFCVHVQHPHKLVITCIQLLELEKNTPLVQRAWNLMNDGLRTNIFVRYEVKTITCACIFLAARQLKVPLPEQPCWWRLFDVHIKDMKAISRELLGLYAREMRSLDELEREVEQLKENLMSMKKVEVREIMKDQPSDSSPAQSLSPGSVSPNVLQSIKTTPSKLEPNPVADVSYRDPAHLTSPVNGVKRDRSEDSRNHSDKRPKLDSPPSHRTPEAYRPIRSPIKLSSDTEHSATPSPQPNGYTTTTRNDTLEDTRKHHRHKHSRSSKHHRHHKDHQYHKHNRHNSRTDASSRSNRDHARGRKNEQYYR